MSDGGYLSEGFKPTFPVICFECGKFLGSKDYNDGHELVLCYDCSEETILTSNKIKEQLMNIDLSKLKIPSIMELTKGFKLIAKIYMDDLRPCPEDFLSAINADDCLKLMRQFKCQVKILSLDHDLGDDQKDGYWFVKQMIDEGLYADEIYLHSANPIGRMNMLKYLQNAQAAGMLPEHVKIHNSPIPFEGGKE